jgi:hypothetical protein
MAILDSKFDILRGWPHGSAVAEDLIAAAPGAGEDTHKEGTWVRLDGGEAAGYTVVSEAKANKSALVGTDVQHLWGLVIEGRGDNSAVESGKVTVLLGGGYIVKLWNDPDVAADAMFTKLNLVPGDAVTLTAGLIVEAAAVDAAEASKVFGHVLKVVTDAAGGDTLEIYVSL